MIDYKKSAELNKCTIRELKAWFRRYPKSSKKVVDICEKCGDERRVDFRYSNLLCTSCVQMGKHHTDATKQKQSNASIGKPKSPKAIRKMSQTRTGKSYPHEGRKRTDTTKRKISDSLTGRKASLEARQHRSATAQGIPYDEWCEFAKEQLYCPRFNEACRESNRAKYGYRCFICNKPQSKNITKTGKVRKLSVHHVDMDKAQGCKSNWKLVPLCMECHGTAHNDDMIARLGYMVKDSKTRGKSR